MSTPIHFIRWAKRTLLRISVHRIIPAKIFTKIGYTGVTEGMDVVNKISVGDKMLKVERIKSVSEESQ